MIAGIINQNSPRRKLWESIFGGPSVPLESPLAVEAEGPDGRRQFYKLAVSELLPGQRAALVRFLSERWKMPLYEVMKLIDDPAHGVPILADDVVVQMELGAFL